MDDLAKIRAAAEQDRAKAAGKHEAPMAASYASVVAAGLPADYPLTRIGQVVVPFHLETRMMLMVGTTGAGKTQAILQQLSIARERDVPAVLVDHGGEMTRYFYREGIDIVFNPMDKRFPGWSPFNELRRRTDFVRVAGFVIRDVGGQNQDWTKKAQQFFADVMRALWERGPEFRTNAHLLYFTLKAPRYGVENTLTLEWLLQDTSSARLFGNKNDSKTLDIVLGIVAEFMEPLTYLRDGSFSITDYVQSFDVLGACRRWLFVSYNDADYQAISPLISMWMEFAVQAGMRLSPSAARRFYLVLDELGSLHKMKALTDALTKLRKYGGVVVAGLQSTAQIEDPQKYGEKGAQTLLSCFGTVLMLRVSDDVTADKMSRMIGDHKIMKESTSTGTTKDGWTNSTTIKEETERLVLASNFTKLPDRAGYLRIAGMEHIQELFRPERLIPVANLPEIAEASILRDDMNLEWQDRQRKNDALVGEDEEAELA